MSLNDRVCIHDMARNNFRTSSSSRNKEQDTAEDAEPSSEARGKQKALLTIPSRQQHHYQDYSNVRSSSLASAVFAAGYSQQRQVSSTGPCCSTSSGKSSAAPHVVFGHPHRAGSESSAMWATSLLYYQEPPQRQDHRRIRVP